MATLETSAAQIIARVRRLGTDLTEVEIKAAGGGLPSSIAESISAFANGTGGTILLGVSEPDGFAPVDTFDHKKIMDALADACANKVEPPVRDPIEIEEVEGHPVVRLDVTELDPVAKPCFVKTRGTYNGSFIRSGDGDRRLTHYEITQLLSNRSQPKHDAEPVVEARLTDFSDDLVEPLLRRVRDRNRRAFTNLDRNEALTRLGAATHVDGELRPTLAGLLCLGEYPQQFFPQLFISFVSLPGLTMGVTTGDGIRFLDNQSLDGPIPLMIDDAMAAVRQNMRHAVAFDRGRRVDHYDYPMTVVRELLVNAVMHRDYSPESRGTQVQVQLYPDRLVVKSSGGLYGSVTPGQLGTQDVSSTRNETLAKLLSDLPLGHSGEPVSENRGSGLPIVVRALRDAGMSPPEFDISPGHVHVIVPQHALLNTEMISWIGTLPARGLTDTQHLALAMMRTNGSVTNEMLRVWGVHRQAATQALGDLVSRGLALKTGGRRYASYRLAEPSRDEGLFELAVLDGGSVDQSDQLENELAAVVEAIRAGHVTSRAISTSLGLSYQATLRRIRKLVDRKAIEPTGPRHSSSQSYRVVS